MFIVIPVVRCKKYSYSLAKGWVYSLFSYFLILKWDFHTETLKIRCSCPDAFKEGIFFFPHHPLPYHEDPLSFGLCHEMHLYSGTLAKEHIWKSVGIPGLLQKQVEDWLWMERPLQNTPVAVGLLTKRSGKENWWRRKHFSDLVFLQATFVWKSLFNVKRLLNCWCPIPSLQGFFCSKGAASGRLRGRVAAALYQISWMLWITGLESNLNWTSLVAAGMSQLRAPQCCSL